MQRLPLLKRSSRTRGAAAVEFALVAPLFLIFLFAIIESGRALFMFNVLSNASREGARYAVLEGATDSEVVKIVKEFSGLSDLESLDVTITPSADDAEPGDQITVNVAVPIDDITWLPTSYILTGDDISVSTTMRREGLSSVN